MSNRHSVVDVLRRHNHIIVHMSGCPKGIGLSHQPERRYFPDDLLDVIRGTGTVQSGVSCSTIAPGDTLDWFELAKNATGEIGVILDVKDGSVVDSHFNDSGSEVNEHGERTTHLSRNTTEALEDSIVSRPMKGNPGNQACYNEWIVKDYLPIGIIINHSDSVRVECSQLHPDNEHGQRNVLFQEVVSLAMNHRLRLIRISNTGYFEFDLDNGEWEPIVHPDLY